MMANPVRSFWHRLTGRDLVEESIESLRITREEMDAQKLARVKVLERNARDAAANFRAAELFDAALLEKEKADALAAEKERLAAKRDRVEESRLAVIREDYHLRRSG